MAPEIIPARGHREYGFGGKTPTCTEDGYTVGRYCGTCGVVTLEQRVLYAPGHKEVVDKGFPATCTGNGLSDGKHCTSCGNITVPQTVLKALDHNIVGDVCTLCNLSIPLPGEFINATLGYITAEDTVIHTNHFSLEVPKNVYVMDNFIEIVNIVSSAMENVSGMSFVGNPNYYKYNGTRERVKVIVVKPEGSECGPAYASGMIGSVISACDIVDLFALIHENSHMLHFRQTGWNYCTWAAEGISTYTTYKTQCYILEHYPELSVLVGGPAHSIGNYMIEDYSKLYEHSMEYWMENTFEYSGNNNYSIGFRFAWFLDEVYGDYTKWIYTYEEYNPHHSSGADGEWLATEEQIKAFKMAYGENIFDEFYAWLKQNEHKFERYYSLNLSDVKQIDLYPAFMAEERFELPMTIQYRDLCIDLSGGIYYLTEYQNKDISALKLDIVVEDTAELLLYDADGGFIRTEKVTGGATIDLSGVYYVKFVGEGTVYRFRIIDFK